MISVNKISGQLHANSGRSWTINNSKPMPRILILDHKESDYSKVNFTMHQFYFQCGQFGTIPLKNPLTDHAISSLTFCLVKIFIRLSNQILNIRTAIEGTFGNSYANR